MFRRVRRRELLRALGSRREELGLTQTAVAAVMGTSQSAVARLESGDVDAKLSTLERYAAALGQRAEWRIAQGGVLTPQARARHRSACACARKHTRASTSAASSAASAARFSWPL